MNNHDMRVAIPEKQWKKLGPIRQRMIKNNPENTSQLLERFALEDAKRRELGMYNKLGHFK